MIREDNRGITLMELIIAITIAVIVMGAATLFIRTAIKSYDTASETIDLQMESQIVMEQISTWIMEGNKVKIVNGNNLVIYQIPRKLDVAKLPSGVAVPSQDASKRIIGVYDGKLYMKVVDSISDVEADTDVGITSADAVVENCIGEYVTDFGPSLISDKENEVNIDIKLEKGTQEYKLTNQIKIRNELRDK